MKKPLVEKYLAASDAIGRLRGHICALRNLAEDQKRAQAITLDAHDDLLMLGDLTRGAFIAALGIGEEP